MIFTLGFDEAFAIRALLRRGINDGDKIIIVIPDKEDSRTNSAIQTIKEVINKTNKRVKIEEIRLQVENFNTSTETIRKILTSHEGEQIYANLSGGMRALVLETLVGIIKSNVKCEIEVDLEDRTNFIKFTTTDIRTPEIEPEEYNILSSFDTIITLSELSKVLNKPKSTLWRKIKKLEEKGLIKIEKKGRKMVIRKTEVGKKLDITKSNSDIKNNIK
jgi:CRISPR-associated protein Csa3